MRTATSHSLFVTAISPQTLMLNPKPESYVVLISVRHRQLTAVILQNKPYKELFEAFLRPGPTGALDLLPLGLYRRHDGMGENHW